MKAAQNSDDFENLIEITLTSEEPDGFVDIILSITSKERIGDYVKIIARGKHQNALVGLSLTILDGTPPGIIKNEINRDAFVKNGVIIESIGEQSDSFIKILSELYGIPSNTNTIFTKGKLLFTLFPLNQETGDLENKALNFKLFYDDLNEENLYNELYLNTNLPQNLIEIREKDEEYRENIIKILTRD